MSNLYPEPQCTPQCRSREHGNIITAAITKRSISDLDLCAFLNFVCCRCESVFDSVGRNALHVAASCGRLNLARWLVTNRHADIDARDRESGYTALHRSIFYGKIHVAIELIKLGASTLSLDHDSLTVLEHAMKDGVMPEEIIGGELYTWGSNTNNLLGPQQARQTPELLDIFHKEYPCESVQQICIAKFHTIIVTCSGKSYSCGHGQGGRLGLGDEKTVVIPRAISFSSSPKIDPVSCVQASISRDHSIFLCSDGYVYTCGLNTYRVLGHSPVPERVLFPKQLKHLSKEVTGVYAGQYHSVAWGPKVLFTWGLNAGQLGHKKNSKSKEQFIVSPKAVNIVNDINITAVAASNGATVVCTKKGDVYVLHEHLCRKIASRQLNVVQISIIGGKLDGSLLEQEISKEFDRELKVAVLTNTGNIFLWQESDPQLCRCIYSINRAIVAKQIFLNTNELLLITNYGEAFKGVAKQRRKKGNVHHSFHNFLEREDCIVTVLQKISKINRAISIQSDLKGRDYCVVQAHPYKYYKFPDIVNSEMKIHFQYLFSEINESDEVHDVIFKIDNTTFPAHKYIVCNKSPYLEKLMMKQKSKIITLNSTSPIIFQQFLQYVYTNECDLTRCGELKNESLRNLCSFKEKKEKIEDVLDIENIPKNVSAYEYYQHKNHNESDEKKPKSILKNPVRMLHELSKRLECDSLQKVLSNLDMEKYTIKEKNENFSNFSKPPTFDRTTFPNLYDVTVKCRDNNMLQAHNCILYARLEYFSNMFSMRWGGNQTTEVTLPFPKSTAEALLEFLYTDSISYLDNTEIDHLFRVLILADQLFVTRLKEQCEQLLSHLITLKNAVQILAFAHLYNAKKLKYCCLKFITLNMTTFLELRSLDELKDDLLNELSEFYFKEKQELWCRVITPYSFAETDENIASTALTYPISMTEEVEKTSKRTGHKKKTRFHRSSLSDKNNSISVEETNLDSLIQFPDVPEEIAAVKTQAPDRLRAIKLAGDIIKNEHLGTNFALLVKKNSESVGGSSLNDSDAFPELNSPPIHYGSSFHSRSPSQRLDAKHKLTKLSQKQRKRLSSESSSLNISTSPTKTVLGSPKNPWKAIPDVTSPILPNESKSTMHDIICDEKKQKENLIKITSKLLVHTQMEDKAIEDLHKFYNTESLDEEIIIIERVNIGAIAAPIWVPRSS